MSFSADLSKYARKTINNAGKVSRAVKISLFSGIIQDTRVDTGRLRGNWQTSTGAPKLAEVERLDKTGELAISEAAENVTAFGVDYMTNNLPYAYVWEEEDGMVSKNLARVERNLKEAVDSV